MLAEERLHIFVELDRIEGHVDDGRLRILAG
jgi:hypothetical protein